MADRGDLGGKPEPAPELAEGDRVLLRMRPCWRLSGELRGVTADTYWVFDSEVDDVLPVRRADVDVIERLTAGSEDGGSDPSR